MNNHQLLTAFTLFLLLTLHATAQETSHADKVLLLSDKIFSALDKKTSAFESSLDKATYKYFQKLQKQEEKLKRKLQKKDSSLASKLFPAELKEQYSTLQSLSASTSNPAYSPRLDSLSTALKFFNGTATNQQEEIQHLLDQYKSLQGKFNATEAAKQFVLDRQALLKQQFRQLGMVKELKKFRKEVYYYQAQVKEYKEAFEDPSKLEKKLLELAMKVPQFKEFFAKNSILGSLFALPDGTAANAHTTLQTRASINQYIGDRFGTGTNISSLIQSNIRSAQGEINSLKDKLGQYSSGAFSNSSEDIDLPDFRPNDQKTKSFLKRIELGTNIQSQKARWYFPVTSDIALSAGYKLNNNGIIGIGLSGKLGFGHGWDSIRLSYQGLGLRSFIDYRIKGGIYISAGYEMNYRNLFNNIQQLQDYAAWQQSGLVGISKRYSISKKIRGELKLLWDFLSYQQLPRTQPILFRIGYQLKK